MLMRIFAPHLPRSVTLPYGHDADDSGSEAKDHTGDILGGV